MRPTGASARRAVGARCGILDSDEIGRLIAAAGPRGALIATAVFTGLRVGERLGPSWRNVDFGAGVICVRWQLSRGGERAEPKKPQARREVILMPALARLLREQKMASAWKAANDPVFATGAGDL